MLPLSNARYLNQWQRWFETPSANRITCGAEGGKLAQSSWDTVAIGEIAKFAGLAGFDCRAH